MGARSKLNGAYFNGAVLVASAIGLSTQSWEPSYSLLAS